MNLSCWYQLVLCIVSLAYAGCTDGLAPAATSSEGYLVGMADARIFYRVEGSGPDTVVVVHGGPGAGMQAIRPDFGPLGAHHTVIYYDQRGGGHSTLPIDTTHLGPAYHVGDLEALRQFFGLDRMNVVAHSFGAVLIAEYALQHPDRLARIVFLGATGPSRAAAAELAQASFGNADTTLLQQMQEPLFALLSGNADDPVAACRAYHVAHNKVVAAHPSKAQGSECLMEPDALRYYFRYTAQLGPALFGDWDYTSLRHAPSAPLLVIYGDDEPEALAVQRLWVTGRPEGRLLVVPETGKQAHADQPDVVFSAIDVFFDGHWPEGAMAVP